MYHKICLQNKPELEHKPEFEILFPALGFRDLLARPSWKTSAENPKRDQRIGAAGSDDLRTQMRCQNGTRHEHGMETKAHY